MAEDWYPGAVKRPISKHVRSRGNSKPNVLILHVTVSPRDSQYSFFKGADVCSTFHVAKDGTVEQYLPVSSKPASDYEGNHRSVSIETQGAWPTSVANSEKWTDAQLSAMAGIYAWLHEEWKLPLRIAASSKPSEAGLAGHRWGIDGNFPSEGPLRGRSERGGGERWSPSYGKVCPGNAKIYQIALVLELAKRETPTDPPEPEKPVKPKWKIIATDGVWGKETTTRLQQYLGTKQDGIISSQYPHREIRAIRKETIEYDVTDPDGSLVVRALQKHIGMTGAAADGLLGPNTVKRLQKYLGTPIDGFISTPTSAMVERMQERLNVNKF